MLFRPFPITIAQTRSIAAENISTLTSEVSSGVVRPQEPIPPSWVLGNVSADDGAAVSEENLPAINTESSAAEQNADPIGDSGNVSNSLHQI